MQSAQTLPIRQYGWISAAAFMSLGMVMWAIIENIPRYFDQHYTTFEIVWLRYSVHLMFMLIVFGPRVKKRLIFTKHPGMQFLRGMLMMGMHLSFIFAIRFLPLNQTMAGFWVAPLLVFGIAALKGERAGWIYWVIALAANCGAVLMLRPITGIFVPTSILSIVMAFCFGMYLLMTRFMPQEDLLASLFYTAFSVWIVLSIMMPFYWVTPTTWDLLLFIAIGLLGYLAIYGLDRSVEGAPVWVAISFAFTQPLFALMIEWFGHGNQPGRSAIAGALIVFISLGFLLYWLLNNWQSQFMPLSKQNESL